MYQAIITIIIPIYIIVAVTAAPIIYNYWAILGLDIFAIVFWIISFALLASEIAPYFGKYTYTAPSTCAYEYAGVCYKNKRGLEFAKRSIYSEVITYRNSLAAAAGLGGLEL